jgi:mannonate dehydratase
MSIRFSRRKAIYGAAGAVLARSIEEEAAAAPARQWPILEGPGTPRLALALGDGGGPLSTNLRPGQPAPGGNAGGRGNARPVGGGYGGYLEQKQAEAPAPAEPANGRGGFRGGPEAYERIRQLGVNHLVGVAAGNGAGPWTVESVRRAVQTAKDNGCVAYNAMLDAPESVRHGRANRAKDLEQYIASVEAAGRGGLPVVEYNFYAHRAIEGYYETVGRARAGYTGFDYELELLIDPETNQVVSPIYRDEEGKITEATLAAFPNAKKIKFKDLPALQSEEAHNFQAMWDNVTYFLKAVIPAAEKAGVRMALHPNDPPAPISRGSQQIMGSVDGWKHLVGIVDSPANGITFDCGVTREMGSDAIATAEWFASRKKINHVHYRNVQVVKPYEKYQEVFIDMGMNDMFGVMKALVKNKYSGSIYPEHPRALNADRDRVAPGGRLPGYPGGGGYTGITFSVAYARAMMQAALESV